LIEAEIAQRLAEIDAHLSPLFCSKRHLGATDRIIVEPVGRLHGKSEGNINRPVEYGPRCGGLLTGDPKDAGVESKHRGHVGQNSGQFSAQLVVGMLDAEIWAVHEHVFLD